MDAAQPQRRKDDSDASDTPKVLVAVSCVAVDDLLRQRLADSTDRVGNGQHLADVLSRSEYDLIIIDETIQLSVDEGWTQTIHALKSHAPVVVITRDKNQERTIAAMRAGASDFIPLAEAQQDDSLADRLFALSKLTKASEKPTDTELEIKRLRQEIEQLRSSHQSLSERNATIERLSADLMQLNIDLSQISRIDPLTRLLNRAAFEACIVNEHQTAVNTSHPYTVIMADVDYFKKFNDAFGHQAGDSCLVRVADAIRQAVRKSDFVGRYGGEEIITLCPGMDAEAGITLAERIRESVQSLAIDHPGSSAADHVTVSLGLAVGPGTACWTQIVGHADRMLYSAKHNGRNRLIA